MGAGFGLGFVGVDIVGSDCIGNDTDVSTSLCSGISVFTDPELTPIGKNGLLRPESLE
jgi:hypothetical protein